MNFLNKLAGVGVGMIFYPLKSLLVNILVFSLYALGTLALLPVAAVIGLLLPLILPIIFFAVGVALMDKLKYGILLGLAAALATLIITPIVVIAAAIISPVLVIASAAISISIAIKEFFEFIVVGARDGYRNGLFPQVFDRLAHEHSFFSYALRAVVSKIENFRSAGSENAPLLKPYSLYNDGNSTGEDLESHKESAPRHFPWIFARKFAQNPSSSTTEHTNTVSGAPAFGTGN